MITSSPPSRGLFCWPQSACYAGGMTSIPQTSPILEQLRWLQAFGAKLNPFEDQFYLEFDGNDEDDMRSYRQAWMKERDEFVRLTGGSRRLAPGSLDDWAKRNVQALMATTTLEEQAEVAVWAAGTYQYTLLEQMLSRRPELHRTPDAQGDTPLHAACAAQNDRALSWLLGKDKHFDQPLRDAQGRLPLARLFCPYQRWGKERFYPRGGEGSARECLRVIHTQAPVLLEMDLGQGNTLLHLAADTKWPRNVCKDLVGFGLKWNTPNEQGQTPADVLAKHPAFQPDNTSNPRNHRFVQEALAASREPVRSAGVGEFLPRLLKRLKLR